MGDFDLKFTTFFGSQVELKQIPDVEPRSVQKRFFYQFKQAQSETQKELPQARKRVQEDLEKARSHVTAIRKEMTDARREISRQVDALKRKVDNKIQKAIAIHWLVNN